MLRLVLCNNFSAKEETMFEKQWIFVGIALSLLHRYPNTYINMKIGSLRD